MNKQEAQQIFDGVMLGDGNLRRYKSNTEFSMSLSKVTPYISMEDNFKWLDYIKNECFIPFGIEVSDIYPKYGIRELKEKQYRYVRLVSHQSLWLTVQYNRWYAPTGEWTVQKGYERYPSQWYRKGDTKIVPEYLTLTPKILAHWLKGDGSVYRSKRSSYTVKVKFHTECFTENEVDKLVSMLRNMNIIANKLHRYKNHFYIALVQESVNHFFDLTSSHMISHRGMIQYKDKPHRGNSHNVFDDLRMKIRSIR